MEELVEVGGELACVAGRVGGGLAGCEAVLNFLALVHAWLVFLSVVFCLFFFVYAGCALPTVRVWVVPLSARVFLFVMVFMAVLLLAKHDCRRLLWAVSCLVRA